VLTSSTVFPDIAVMVAEHLFENANESPDIQAQLPAGTPERRNAGTPERRNAGTPERFIIT